MQKIVHFDNFARENWIQQKIEVYKNNFEESFDTFEFDFISKRKKSFCKRNLIFALLQNNKPNLYRAPTFNFAFFITTVISC